MSALDEFTLAEQRFRTRVTGGGRGTVHVVLYSTFRGTREPAGWTRRACDRRALCGSLGATVVGIDATTWDTTRFPIPPAALNDVNCRRCRASYQAWLKRFLPAPDRPATNGDAT